MPPIHAFLLRSRDLVADAFAGDLALELGEGEQHVEGQPAHRCRGVDLLGHRDDGHLTLVEDFHDPGEVTERACQSIHLVDDHSVDPMVLDIRENQFQGGSLKGATGEAAVIVHLGQRGPTLVLLTEDKGFAGFPLCSERVEVLLEAVLR